MGIQSLLSDPLGYLYSVLLLLPAVLPALILHECAHGYAACRLGDPTAKLMGRLSLNPLKHLDPVGTLCMVFLGLGWAKPVPINPSYFKNPRRDDLIVSLAGITANLLMFVLGCLLMLVMLLAGIRLIPDGMWTSSAEFLTVVDGVRYRLSTSDVAALPTLMGDYLISPYMGAGWGVVYEILVNFVCVNMSLAIFNLLPVPPLDGYHVLNDLVLKKRLFASRRIAMVGQAALFVLLWSGYLSKFLNAAAVWLLTGVGRIFSGLFSLLGLL